MNRINSFLLTFVFTVAFGLGFTQVEVPNVITGDNLTQVVGASEVSGNVAYAEPKQSVFEGKNIDASGDETDEVKGLVDKLRTAANVFAALVLVVSIIMIVVGALKYILSSGNQQQAAEAKMVLIYSGIGIVVALSAFALGRMFSYFGF